MLLWSGVGGQLLSSCCCGQGLVVSYYHHVAVVRGWWFAIVIMFVIMLLWSVVGGQLRTRSLEGPFRRAFGKTPQVSFQTPQVYLVGLQSPQTSGAVPSHSRGALQHDTSTSILRQRSLDGDASARVVEVKHPDCTCGAQRQNFDLIAEMQLRPHSGDSSFQDWRCWRKHTTCNTDRITSPQFCNHGEWISGF